MLTRSLSCLALVSLALFACTPEGPGAAPSATPTAGSTSAAPAASGAAELVSGVSIGPLRVGMTRGELEALKLPMKAGVASNELLVGSYSVRMEGDRAASVRLRLLDFPAGARVGGTVFVATTATIESIAKVLPGCGPVQVNEGGNVIVCDSGKTVLTAGGPPGIVELRVNDAARAATYASTNQDRGAPAQTSFATWTHPGMAMTFSYPDKLLTVSKKPDGATLKSEILGKIEDRSGQGKDKPQPLTITVSVRVGKLADVLKAERIESKDCQETTLNGVKGCSFRRGSHDAQQDMIYAALPNGKTLEVICDYLGEMGKPKVSMAEQTAACDKVVHTLSYKP